MDRAKATVHQITRDAPMFQLSLCKWEVQHSGGENPVDLLP